MSKRQEKRAQQRRKNKRNRILAILSITLIALGIALFLIWSGMQSTKPGSIVQITPRAASIPMEGTSMGNPDAPVKMDVWEDFQCSGCLAYSRDIEPQLVQTYIETGKVYYTFHLYPFIDGGQGESHDAANAALCAAAQGRFWDYHDIVFANWLGENAGSYTKPRLVDFARSIGLDLTSFERCFQENTFSVQIQQDVTEGSKLGVPPTPGIFVNGTQVVSSAGKNYIPSFDDISRAIEAGLNAK